MKDDINQRKRKILKAIIHEHIFTAEPVGSRTLAKLYELGVSSATIRNEMSDLEELGYLEQPYTSAGRIPSDKGYRFYVDALIKDKDIFKMDIRKAVDFEYEKQGIQSIISNMARMLSRITRYTSIVCEPQLKVSKINKLQLIPVDRKSVLILLITDTGLVHNKVVKLKKEITNKKINYINRFLSERLQGEVISKIDNELLEELELKLVRKLDVSHGIMELINNNLIDVSNPDDFQIYLGGTSYILEQPEFNDIENLKKVLNILDHREILREIFLKMPNRDLEVMIGHENELEEMKSCSIVFGTYTIGEGAYGKIGVIGPTRMEYSRVIASVNKMADLLGNIISELSG